MRRASRCAGFTLLEVIVAVALTATVALMAYGLTTAARVAERATQSNAQKTSEVIVAETLLRDLASHATTLTASIGRTAEPAVFAGDPSRMTFTSRCLNASGSREPCQVALQSTVPQPGVNIAAARSEWTLSTIGAVSFRYLSSVDRAGEWVETWKEARKLPAGIAVVGSSDTIVLRLGTPR
jgi:prepilin-type N-terminal cleavage/methylation domain-containing protein